jgi:hypothetical protein
MGKKKQGRPNKKAGLGRDELLQVRVTAAEKSVFADAAEMCGMETSVWVRDVLRRAARERIVEGGQPDPFSVAPSEKKE